MRIKNPITKTVHFISLWSRPTWRITSRGPRRSWVKVYSFKGKRVKKNG